MNARSDDRAREPDANSDAKADAPTDLKGPTWKYMFKRAAQEFGRDELTDKAAALTYYAVLSLFPALIALVSMLGVFGQGQATTDALTNLISDYAPDDVASQLEGPISSITQSPGAGIGLIVGLLTALW
ncbi:YhjD/YihY/BrkB family envelope integrity protein, partial [Georgenia sp. 10Sc9-8]|nr:YhjD/YihY/BrkB family envelope integrity protein [Georgenia halotolerans]